MRSAIEMDKMGKYNTIQRNFVQNCPYIHISAQYERAYVSLHNYVTSCIIAVVYMDG